CRQCNRADDIRQVNRRTEKLLKADTACQDYRKKKRKCQHNNASHYPDKEHVRHRPLECGATEYLNIVVYSIKRPIGHAAFYTLNPEETHKNCTDYRIQIHDKQAQSHRGSKCNNKSFTFFHF